MEPEHAPVQATPPLQALVGAAPLAGAVEPRAAAILTLQRTYGNAAVVRSLARAPHATTPDAPQQRRHGSDATGSFEAAGPDGPIALQLNSAGEALEGWWEERHRDGQGPTSLERTFVRAQYVPGQGDPSYAYERRVVRGSRTAIAGTLVVTDDGLTVTDHGRALHFERTGGLPRLSDEELALIPGDQRELIETAVGTPLTTGERRIVGDLASHIRAQLLAYVAAPDSVTGRFTIAANLSTHVGAQLSQIAPEQLPLVRRRLRMLLDEPPNTAVDNGITRPLWDHLTLLAFSHQSATAPLQHALDIVPPAQGYSREGPDGQQVRQHTYHYEFGGLARGLGIRFGLGVSGGAGAFTIRKTGPDTWSHTFWMATVGTSIGLGAGASVAATGSGDMQAPYPWAINDFLGEFEIRGASGPSGALIVGGGYTPAGVSVIEFRGSGLWPSMTADAGGPSGLFGLSASLGEFGVLVGVIAGGRDEAVQYCRDRAAAIHVDAAVSSSSANQFATDDPSLTAAERESLEHFAARHRVALERRGSRLEVVGHASRRGPVDRNTQLADLRAHNALQAIVDALGPSLLADVDARGEASQEAEQEGVPRDDDAARFRRTDVFIDSRLELTLE